MPPTGKLAVTRSLAGSIRQILASPATQTMPSPTTRAFAVASPLMVATTRLVAGSRRLTVPVRRLATQTASSVAATTSGIPPTGIRASTCRGRAGTTGRGPDSSGSCSCGASVRQTLLLIGDT